MATKDRRFTVTSEFTGHISGKKRFVVRFCGERLDDFAKRDEAEKDVARRKKEGDHPVVTYKEEAAY